MKLFTAHLLHAIAATSHCILHLLVTCCLINRTCNTKFSIKFIITHAASSWCMCRVITGTCLCVCSLAEMTWAIHTKRGSHTLYGRISACLTPRSKGQDQGLWIVLPLQICMLIWLLMFLVDSIIWPTCLLYSICTHITGLPYENFPSHQCITCAPISGSCR